MPPKEGAGAEACGSVGSTSIKISDTGFCLRYTEQTNAAKPETCHRALSINPLYAEGQAKHRILSFSV